MHSSYDDAIIDVCCRYINKKCIKHTSDKLEELPEDLYEKAMLESRFYLVKPIYEFLVYKGYLTVDPIFSVLELTEQGKEYVSGLVHAKFFYYSVSLKHLIPPPVRLI